MRYEELAAEVQRRGGLESFEEAERALAVTARVLGERLVADEAGPVAAALPEPLAARVRGAVHCHDFDLEELYDRVARGEGSGRRFGAEDGGYSEFALEVLKQPQGIAIEIFDETMRAQVESLGVFREASEAGEVLRAASVSELADRFGPAPAPVDALLAVARFRTLARRARLDEVVLTGSSVRFHPVELPESRTMRLTRLYPGSIVKPAVRTILVPKPSGGDILAWAADLIASVLEPDRSSS